MKIAVIGGGISGNVSARLLSQEHEVQVFEAERRMGGHARTVDVNVFGEEYRVDTGFMVFNARTYPNFCELLRLLDVPAQDADMSLSVCCEATGLEYQGSSLDGLFAQRRNLLRPRFHRMLWDILRFNRSASALAGGELGERSMREVLAESRPGSWFVEKYLLPMSASIWSCPPGRLLDFPARFLLGFLRNHGLLQIHDRPQWKTILGGARRYVEALMLPIRDRIRADSPVESVRRHADHVVVQARNRAPEVFEHVVLACHADQALAILDDADESERAMLRSFPYQANTAVLHTDTDLLPRRRRAWASWNCRVTAEKDAPVMVTYDLSRLQNLRSPSPILLTLNGEESIAPAESLDRFVFHHPVFTIESLRAQSRHAQFIDRRRTSFCGAYWGYGFHEDGVKSALAVARCFGLGMDTWKAACTRESCTTSV